MSCSLCKDTRYHNGVCILHRGCAVHMGAITRGINLPETPDLYTCVHQLITIANVNAELSGHRGAYFGCFGEAVEAECARGRQIYVIYENELIAIYPGLPDTNSCC